MRAFHGLILSGLLAALAACNTVGGLGQDIQEGGQAITGTAAETEAQM